MALLEEERLGDALLLIYGAAAVAIPGLGHLWRGIRACIGSEGWPGLTAVSPLSSCQGIRGGFNGNGVQFCSCLSLNPKKWFNVPVAQPGLGILGWMCGGSPIQGCLDAHRGRESLPWEITESQGCLD